MEERVSIAESLVNKIARKNKIQASPRDYRFKHRIEGNPKAKKQQVCEKFQKPSLGTDAVLRESSKMNQKYQRRQRKQKQKSHSSSIESLRGKNDIGIENYKGEADKYYIKVNKVSDDHLKNLWGFVTKLDE